MMLRFTIDDAERAFKEWGANCGPSAIAAAFAMTLDEVRPHMGDFESKHYTNPTLMWSVLKGIGLPHWKVKHLTWPGHGLVRIQWHGPWMEPGVPVAARYRQTHWVAAHRGKSSIGIFDVNALNSGGWISLDDWTRTLVPYITQHVPRANGEWSITHVVECDPAPFYALRERRKGVAA